MRHLLSAALTAGLVALIAGAGLMLAPGTPLPDHWNAARPLDVSAPVTPLTRWKLARSDSGPACFAALETAGAEFDRLPDVEDTPECHIRERVRLTALGGVAVDPLETRCAVALRLALWTRHGLAPAAEGILGAGLRRLHHLDSYNCRRIRTPNGPGARMSSHATAQAVDITGMTLDDGRVVGLAGDWSNGPEGEFLRAARDSACLWFATTLGPDFNQLHADHFHLQSRGPGLCR